jgi:hypothetical protein
VRSTLGVECAVPLWGTPDEGNASAKTRHRTRLSERAPLLAHSGVPRGVSIDLADVALGTEAQRAALGDPLCITRLPATYSACGRVLAEAVAYHHGAQGGGRTQTPPTPHRSGPFSTVAAARGTVAGKADRAVVGPSRRQDQRRQQSLRHALQASAATLEATVREGAQQV